MGNFKQLLKHHWRQFRAVVRNEYRTIFTDAGVVLVLIFAILIYSTLYSLVYDTEVLRDVPIGVVDESHTAASRRLVETFDAGPNVHVACSPTDMEAARRLFFDREIYGVVHIPADYEARLLAGGQAVVPLYVDASYFLMYRQAFQELVAGIGTTGATIEFQRLVAGGAGVAQAEAMTQPIIYEANNLFNPYLGYGSFVMPMIVIVIIQQTLLIGIGIIGGTWREFNLYRRLIPPGRERMDTLPVVAGKAFVYVTIYAVTALYILGVHFPLFHLPASGGAGALTALLVPYLLACIFLGIFLSTLFRYREQSIMLLLWTSIPILLLSGASLPSQAMPGWLHAFGSIFPSSHGVNAFIRIQEMGAGVGDVLHEIRWLCALTLVYGGLAVVGIRHRLRKC